VLRRSSAGTSRRRQRPPSAVIDRGARAFVFNMLSDTVSASDWQAGASLGRSRPTRRRCGSWRRGERLYVIHERSTLLDGSGPEQLLCHEGALRTRAGAIEVDRVQGPAVRRQQPGHRRRVYEPNR